MFVGHSNCVSPLEAANPAVGHGWFSLVTGKAATSSEGTLGFATGAERSNFNACN